MMLKHLIPLIIIVSTIYAKEECAFTLAKNYGHIYCSNITSEDYLSSMFSAKTSIINSIEEGNIAKVSIEIEDSYLPVVDDWLFLPLDLRYYAVKSIKIVNSSVTNFAVRNLSKLSLVETLDLSRNNISDYKFLNKMKKLISLTLSHSVFELDSYLFVYLQRSQIRLKTIDLSFSNLENFSINSHTINEYNLSHNPNLTLIRLNYSAYDRVPHLILSGIENNIEFQHFRYSKSICISLDMSESNKSFEGKFYENIKIWKKLSLRNNNIQKLDENIFALNRLLSKECVSRLSLDLSKTNLVFISSSFFNLQILDVLDLSSNNLTTLLGSIFYKADILHLDLSNSFINTINRSVFNFLTVEKLDLSKNNLTHLDEVFDYIESVKYLDISNNPLEFLRRTTFKSCHDLETLDLTNVFLKSPSENPFSSIVSLRKLTLSFNTSVDSVLINNMYVTELVVTNTTLSNLQQEQFKGFYKLKNLTFVSSTASEINKFAFRGLYNLKRLNNLKKLLGNYDISIFQPLNSLEYLDLSGHNLKKLNLELKDLVSLKKLNLSLNALSSIDSNSFATLKQLEILSIAYNQLFTIAVETFRALSKLTHLYLNSNQLQQLQPGLFSSLDNLILLDLSGNDLLRTKPHLVFAVSMAKLKFLHLQGNGMGNEYAKGDDILRKNEFSAIANHNSLDYIDINENGWKCITLVDIISVLKSKNISYKPSNPVYIATNINGVRCT